jgi:hypothetical protein
MNKNEPDMKMLNIGLVLDSVASDKYVYELALWGKSQANINVSHLILYTHGRNTALAKFMDLLSRRRLHLLPAKIVFRTILLVEKMLLRWSDCHKDHYRSCDLTKIIDQIVEIKPIVSRSGFVYRFSEEDIEKVKALDLDLLIRCGGGILRGNILRASRLGVISFHHGDNKVNRGGPAGFWESYYRWPQTGFIIQRLTEELDAGEVLVRGFFGTRFYYSLNQAHVYKKSLTHLKNLLKKVASAGCLPPIDRAPAPYSNILFRAPNLAQCIVYGCKLLKRLSVKAIARILMPEERWGISVLSAKWSESVFWRSTEVSPPKGRFWADPFLCTRGGKTFCFVEDFVFRTGKAHITALEISGTKVVEHGIALKEPFHLSFPFLFEYQGELYMCPETCASGQVRVYRCTDFPLKWKLEKILMEGVCAADSMLFHKGGKWWMFTSIDESGTGDYGSELYLFSSDSPLNTTWVPHPQNPIRIDSFGGRNSGLIIEGEKIFRLAQGQGFDRYGHSLLVHEIKELSESHYVEDLVATISPNFRRGLLGTHHLSTDGKTTVIDHVSRSSALWHRSPKPSPAGSAQRPRRTVARAHAAGPLDAL